MRFTTDLTAAVDGAEAIFIAVGTPSRRGEGHADLTYVMAAAADIAKALIGYADVVAKSIVPDRIRADATQLGRRTGYDPLHYVPSERSRLNEPGVPFPDWVELASVNSLLCTLQRGTRRGVAPVHG